MSRPLAVYVCGGDLTPGPRGTDCPDPLHDHPLPTGFVDASEVAEDRRCRRCGSHGWAPPTGYAGT